MFDTPRFAVAKRFTDGHTFVTRVFGHGSVIHTSFGAYEWDGDQWAGSPRGWVAILAVYDTQAEARQHVAGA